MDTMPDVLIAQLAIDHDQTSWFASLDDALKNVTVEQACWRHPHIENSIWDIVNHLTFWSERWLLRFKDMPIEKSNFTNDDTFFRTKKTDRPSEEDWQRDRTHLNHVLNEWRKVLTECGDEKLNSKISDGTVWWMVLSNIILHLAYHTGQIVYLQKLQGCWKPIAW